MQVRFLEVTAMIKRGLRERLELSATGQRQEADDEAGILNSVYNWFVAKPVVEENNEENSGQESSHRSSEAAD